MGSSQTIHGRPVPLRTVETPSAGSNWRTASRTRILSLIGSSGGSGSISAGRRRACWLLWLVYGGAWLASLLLSGYGRIAPDATEQDAQERLQDGPMEGARTVPSWTVQRPRNGQQYGGGIGPLRPCRWTRSWDRLPSLQQRDADDIHASVTLRVEHLDTVADLVGAGRTVAEVERPAADHDAVGMQFYEPTEDHPLHWWGTTPRAGLPQLAASCIVAGRLPEQP